MKKQVLFIFVLSMIFLAGCDMAGNEERAIRDMCKTLITAIDKDDEDLAFASIIDRAAFNALNPSAKARSDGESYIDDILSDLIHTFRYYSNKYHDRDIKFKKFLIGHQVHQYKGFSAYRDNQIVIEIDGVEELIEIGVIVRIGSKWRIVEIDRND
ncbi:MAG: hypothetical protein HQ568_02955 [Calditrichaeota bacterium]|nr:hypothetical protein [Calditrichota bacterium]